MPTLTRLTDIPGTRWRTVPPSDTRQGRAQLRTDFRAPAARGVAGPPRRARRGRARRWRLLSSSTHVRSTPRRNSPAGSSWRVRPAPECWSRRPADPEW